MISFAGVMIIYH